MKTTLQDGGVQFIYRSCNVYKTPLDFTGMLGEFRAQSRGTRDYQLFVAPSRIFAFRLISLISLFSILVMFFFGQPSALRQFLVSRRRHN